MKIIFCLAFETACEDKCPTESSFGIPIEVSEVPKLGETIKMKWNVFNFIFKDVRDEFKDNIIFYNHISKAVVTDVIHSFRGARYPDKLLFSREKEKQEIYTYIHSEEHVEQCIYVVIDFHKQ